MYTFLLVATNKIIIKHNIENLNTRVLSQYESCLWFCAINFKALTSAASREDEKDYFSSCRDRGLLIIINMLVIRCDHERKVHSTPFNYKDLDGRIWIFMFYDCIWFKTTKAGSPQSLFQRKSYFILATELCFQSFVFDENFLLITPFQKH